MRTWICDVCGTVFVKKDDLIECLNDHISEASQTEDEAERQLERIGGK